MDWLLASSLILRSLALVVAVYLVVRSRDFRPGMLAAILVLAIIRLLEHDPEALTTLQRVNILVISILCLAGAVAAHSTLRTYARKTAYERERGEARYQRLVDTAQEGIWSIDREGRTNFVNARLASMLGYSAEEMLGRYVVRFIADEYVEAAREKLSQPPGEPELQVTCLERKDGERLWVRLAINALFDESGRYDGALAMVTDISEQRTTELRGRARNRILEKFAADAPVEEILTSLCMMLEDGLEDTRATVLLIDEVAGILTFGVGPSLPPLLREAACDPGLPIDEWIEDTRTHPAWAEARDLAARAEVGSCWSIPVRAPDGATVLGVVRVFRRNTGAPSEDDQRLVSSAAKLAGVAITRHRTVAELDRTLALLSAAIEQNPTGILIADAPSGRVRVGNAAALGVEPGETLDPASLRIGELPLGWVSCLPDGTPLRDDEQPLFRAVLGHTVRNVEIVQRREDGLKRWALVNAAPVRDSLGQVQAGIAVYLDITARKRDDRDLQRLLKSLGSKSEELEQLFRATTHDLRAPLINIDGFARELELGLAELERLVAGAEVEIEKRREIDERVRDLRVALEHVRSGADRMEHLMKGMAQLNEVDRQVLAFDPIDMQALISEVVGGFEYQLREHDVHVEVSTLPPCIGDSTQIGRVLSNLIDNAIKYRSPDRPATIRVAGRKTSGDRVVYSIEDDGIGIAREDLERIFFPFQRLGGPVEGDGLGLSILRRIVARLDGRVRASSTPGVGSRFEIDLPAAGEATRPAAAAALGEHEA